MKEHHFKNTSIEMWLEDGIVYGIFSPQAVISEETAKEIVRERLKIAGNKTYPTLSDYTKNIQIDKKARDFFATSDSVKQVSAGAILVSNYVQELIGNAFLRFNKPKIPAKLFTKKEEALTWLEVYKNKNLN